MAMGLDHARKQWIATAIRTLENYGYVVVPKDRHVVLTVDKAVSGGLLEQMSAEDAKGLQERMGNAVAHEIGYGLRDLGAITKEDLGPDPDMRIYRWRYQARVILPKP